VLAAVTGSAFFPGGVGSYTVTNLTFEQGPTAPVQLQWASYFDAADQAGISRIWGGIHPPVDDFTGRRVGSQVGQSVWALARQYFDGSIIRAPMDLQLAQLNGGATELQFNTVRGLFYKIQSTSDLNLPFGDEPGAPVLSFDTSLTTTNSAPGTHKFYRAACLLGP
jgi:hypothetical protein